MKDICLIISCKKEYWDFVRPYKIYIDGTYLGSLRNGQTKMFLIEKGRHTVKVVQAMSFSRSKKYYLEGSDVSPIYLEASTSLLGSTANLMLLFFLFFIGIEDYFNLDLAQVFSYLLYSTMLIGTMAFFILSHRYIVIKPSRHPVDLEIS